MPQFIRRSLSTKFIGLLSAVLALFIFTTAGFAAERSVRKISVDGLKRSYIVHVPDGISKKSSVRVLFVFHPGGITARAMERLSKIHTKKGADEYIVVYPDGIGLTWNAGDCCGKALKQNVNDLGFVLAMFQDLGRFGKIASDGHFATGYSNGAAMSYNVACRLGDRFDAVAGVSGQFNPSKGCSAKEPISVLQIHGTADEFSPYNGGKSSFDTDGPARGGIPNLINFWVNRDNCKAERTTKRMGTAICTQHTSCSAGTVVELCRIEGMGHVWPGHTVRGAWGKKLGPGRPDLDASASVVKFFNDIGR